LHFGLNTPFFLTLSLFQNPVGFETASIVKIISPNLPAVNKILKKKRRIFVFFQNPASSGTEDEAPVHWNSLTL
jgi:hypothetical protein